MGAWSFEIGEILREINLDELLTGSDFADNEDEVVQEYVGGVEVTEIEGRPDNEFTDIGGYLIPKDVLDSFIDSLSEEQVVGRSEIREPQGVLSYWSDDQHQQPSQSPCREIKIEEVKTGRRKFYLND
jgi:hypothetical protein